MRGAPVVSEGANRRVDAPSEMVSGVFFGTVVHHARSGV